MKLTRGGTTPDLVTAEPEQAKVLLENERVRVLDVRVGVGQRQAMHSHPDHLIYALSAYRVKHTAADGGAVKVAATNRGQPPESPRIRGLTPESRRR